MTAGKKNVYSLLLSNLSSLIALYYGCFTQNILLVELTAHMNDVSASFSKTTPLISKYFLRIHTSLDIMSDIFKLRENTYNLINFHIFESQNPRTKNFGFDSIAYRASQLWKNVPEEI